MERRKVLKSVALAAGAGLLAARAEARSVERRMSAPKSKNRGVPFITVKDGTTLFCKDWGAGKPVVFVNNWAHPGDMWQYQMVHLTAKGFRCVAYDRRGNGRSSQPADGYDYDTLSDDLATILDELDLREVTLVGHSMGGGEVVRYLTRHGPRRIARIVLIAPTTPFLLKTADNPEGQDKSAFDELRAAWCKDFPKWLADAAPPYFVPAPSPQMSEWAVNLALQCPLYVAIACSHTWSETDFRAELPKIGVPTLVIQGDKDTLPIDLTGRKTAPLIRGARLSVYEGAAHGLMFTHMDRLNADLLSFASS